VAPGIVARPRSRRVFTWSIDGRWLIGLSTMNTRPELAEPPAKTMTFSTDGSLAMIAAKRVTSRPVAWNDVS
jgi:hypothetical protein